MLFNMINEDTLSFFLDVRWVAQLRSSLSPRRVSAARRASPRLTGSNQMFITGQLNTDVIHVKAGNVMPASRAAARGQMDRQAGWSLSRSLSDTDRKQRAQTLISI